jgi:hypothetical protein
MVCAVTYSTVGFFQFPFKVSLFAMSFDIITHPTADLIQIIRLDKKKERQGSFSAWARNDESCIFLLVAWDVGTKGQEGQKDLSAKQ